MSTSSQTLVPGITTIPGTGAYAEQNSQTPSPEIPSLRFYLGTHHPGWLRSSPVPLFVSDRRLRGYRTMPTATGPWALDSGGFTELATHGSWDNGPTPNQYVARIRRYAQEIGSLAWAAPQDWMCEPWIVAKTGLSVAEHQSRTVDNYLRLRDLAPDLPIIPVLQGWRLPDYLACLDLYQRAGVDLAAAPVVGLGSVCRRQSTTEAAQIVAALHEVGVQRLHGFGFKVQGLARCRHLLVSADSMAWSYAARRRPPLPGCTTHINCANCPRYAYAWYHHILTALPTTISTQPPLFSLQAGCGRTCRDTVA